MKELEQLRQQAALEIQEAQDLRSLDDYRIHYLGKKGKLTEYLKSLGQLPAEERPLAGQKINSVKEEIQVLIEGKVTELQARQVAEQLIAESIDVTLPGRRQPVGGLHPITQIRERIEIIFKEMGFLVAEGPEIENDYYNFEALNVPALHPARSMMDTFYFEDGLLLRTHTSPIQIRFMELNQPPFRMIAVGRVFRRDFDITHTPMFHQVEGLVVDERVTFADLKGLLTEFLQTFFNTAVPIRFRPSYFPFTEPSAEVDIGCVRCEGQGCRICSNTGWLEVLGCGMVHPKVLQGVKVDPERYRGFAFGIGFDRLALLRYSIPDLRTLFENDLRFLQQF
jgi:phenylalanyl-tRNA synthetase alpha chain